MIQPQYYLDAPAYCKAYFDLLPSEDILSLLHSTARDTDDIFTHIPAHKHDHAYAEGKWTVKEVLVHIIDCERINAYRAFRFSRFDATELPGFDEDKYIAAIKPLHFSVPDLLADYHDVRQATQRLYQYLSDDMLDFKGRANNHPYTARTLGFMTLGHNLHHCKIIRELYL